jgi:hypothetical protein
MTDPNTDNSASPGDNTAENNHNQTQIEELAQDTETKTTRRRVCQALSVLGSASLAGCNWLGSTEDPTVTPTESERSTTRTPGSVAPNIATLIETHVETLAGQSYSIDMGLQAPGTSPDIKKEIGYQRSASGQPFVSMKEVSTIDDGVEALTHYFSPDLHGVKIGFADGSSNAAGLDIATQVLEITGASVFDEFLLGAAISEQETDGESVTRYSLDSHRRVNLTAGALSVGSDGIIRHFRMEWRGPDGISRWVEADTYDVGTTEVDIPDF